MQTPTNKPKIQIASTKASDQASVSWLFSEEKSNKNQDIQLPPIKAEKQERKSEQISTKSPPRSQKFQKAKTMKLTKKSCSVLEVAEEEEETPAHRTKIQGVQRYNPANFE